ncbi:MAG: ABC transporter ATP-binding protein [Hyphomicrobiales bacterium]|nr:ABC transporter ATP-binding protein [Hyphomicrobiales bacterium]MDE2114391.1 ABC transporter ATP-binding protein [Hyphomicrobiales bacterium]
MTQAPRRAPSLETIGMSKTFGTLQALTDVSIKIASGSFHALLGENGAGKSTLVKCIMGFYQPSSGAILVDGAEADLGTPARAAALGLGMVYQHFTLVPSLTGAENLVISRADVGAVINWRAETRRLDAFMATMPFSVPLDVPTGQLAAGQKQKLEILKQLYLGRRFLILDEPTSVLTPDEAHDVLGLLRAMTVAGDLTVLMISHKFHEVTAFADEVSVLRKGVFVGTGKTTDLSAADMASMMIGDATLAVMDHRASVATEAEPTLLMQAITAPDRTGLKTISIANLAVRPGEIVGIAGIAGNGQKELLEILAGQRPMVSGTIRVQGGTYSATREDARHHHVRFIPEEPLQNACAPRMSVAENLALHIFDVDKNGKNILWLDRARIKQHARTLIEAFKVKTASLASPITALSGGNVQRAVLARELTGEVDLLIVANPCFGLDFSAVAEIRARIMQARNAGTAVLLISEDLDELFELSDRILVMSSGEIVFETPIGTADVSIIGSHMAGHH